MLGVSLALIRRLSVKAEKTERSAFAPFPFFFFSSPSFFSLNVFLSPDGGCPVTNGGLELGMMERGCVQPPRLIVRLRGFFVYPRGAARRGPVPVVVVGAAAPKPRRLSLRPPLLQNSGAFLHLYRLFPAASLMN